MRCDLQHDKVAVWWSTKYALRLNAFAAAVLLHRDLLEPTDIEPCRRLGLGHLRFSFGLIGFV